MLKVKCLLWSNGREPKRRQRRLDSTRGLLFGRMRAEGEKTGGVQARVDDRQATLQAGREVDELKCINLLKRNQLVVTVTQ